MILTHYKYIYILALSTFRWSLYSKITLIKIKVHLLVCLYIHISHFNSWSKKKKRNFINFSSIVVQ